MSELPEGWASVELGVLTSPSRPRCTPSEFPHLPFVGMEQVEAHTRKLLGTIPSATMKSSAFRFLKGDVLYGRLRPYLNKVYCAEFEGLCSSEFIVLPSSSAFFSKYLHYYLNTENFVAFANQLNQGDRPRVNFDQIRSHQIPLPPLNEQRRIVAKLEKLLSRMDAAQARLATIPLILKRFRQSVLAAACSGRLTADWRMNNPHVETAAMLVTRINEKRKAEYEAACEKAKRLKERKPKPLHHASFIPVIENGEDDIPANWCITRIGDAGECLDYKRIPVNKDERLKRQGTIPYYGANGQTGWIDDYIFDEDLVLLVEDETFVGREIPFSYVIRGKSWVNNHAHVIKPCGEISADYLNICWSYYNFTPLTSGTTGRRKLTQEALLEAAFPIAPLTEQQEIVRRVEALFKTADALEARYRKAKAHVDKLTQSILAKAFRGELVPTEAELARQEGRDYEPASALLERIRQEREPSQPTAKPARKAQKKRDTATKRMFA